ncbi:VOC family protein [Parahaliea mediterranea]|uniref:Aldoketomutase n=1 Tax=Parahaliea mediterranea TaxID=651086 RepID=A0A939DFS8_9GAMM|nr:VOC family protein [Parahaliea mediterranea]MBN7797081.1 VOC family protein [Parahaliea mediterranea]
MASKLGQYCITVSDLERSVAFYRDILGLQDLQRISIPGAEEAILGSPGSDGRIQLAQRESVTGPIDHGNALWKLYLYCDDARAVHNAAVAAGAPSDMAPARLEGWPVIAAFIRDPDGYAIEILQRLEA